MNRNPPEGRRFKPGQSGNPNGRPKKRLSLEELFEGVPDEDYKKILLKQVEKAKRGDRLAAVFCFEYRFGKPQQFMDLTTAGRAISAGAEIDYTQLSQQALDEILRHTRLIENHETQDQTGN